MKFSEAWLRDWVNPPLRREALFEQLTMAGFEVEAVDPVAGEFTGVVVGEVVSVSAHPQADKLSVCEVDDGERRLQVVCGAPNVRAGMKSPFARVGAVLPGGLAIGRAELRGVASEGMLLSAAELGLSDDHSGIVELPATLESGTGLQAALGLDDVMVELAITPNRGDCLSLKGLAREVGVLNNLPVQWPEIHAVPAAIHDTFGVALAAPAACPRYLGRVIRGIDIGRPSPGWLVEKLRRSGLRSIDPVVDVTNFVMLELGQPMHAFDLSLLEGRIVVRMAEPDEKLLLLDGREVSLDAGTLLITDDAGPVAIAGVMGGERSGVQAGTTDVFLECAFFSPLAVAGTARRYGLHTDAAQRYERGVDFELQVDATERATRLLLDIVGGEAGPVTEAVAPEHLPEKRNVTLRERRLHELVGLEIAPSEVDEALERLGFRLLERLDTERHGVSWTVEAPSHRFDIECEADLVEEVCRIYGYNRVPARMPRTALDLRPARRRRGKTAELRMQLTAQGFQEAITYSFVDPRLQDLVDPSARPLALQNPLSSEMSVMRTSLLPGLLEALRTNLSRQQERVRLFEAGVCFVPGERLLQEPRIAGVCCGARLPVNWAQSAEPVDFFDVKGVVERLFEWAGHEEVIFEPAGPAQHAALHPGQSATVRMGERMVGRLGRLHPEIESALDITKPVYVFEIAEEALLNRGARAYRDISRYPSVRRDLALVVHDRVPAAAVESVVRETLGELLVDFTLFDVYQGKGIDSNEKSLAVGLTLQDASATLTEDRIGRCVQEVVAALEQAVGARLRSGAV